ncbi:60S ribosomal protein L8B [Modicella reniformis]|uniref:60S ribosomal protein L8 n=1 Tax=Modicella reniformis TaxID=1440133 RepID=A0A9P6ML45_9FUNG|nr:60S ribosomal protein L8B [Modicella reniformis]
MQVKTASKKVTLAKKNPAASQDTKPRFKGAEYARLIHQRALLATQQKSTLLCNQLKHPLDKELRKQLIKFANKYRPETSAQKKERLIAAANAVAPVAEAPAHAKKNGAIETEELYILKFGINHVAALVEAKKTKLVIIADDVEPLETVAWLSSTCRKRGVPFAIINGKDRLGTLVNKKNAAAIAFTNIRTEHNEQFASLIADIKADHLEKEADRKRSGIENSGLMSSMLLWNFTDMLKKSFL